MSWLVLILVETLLVFLAAVLFFAGLAITRPLWLDDGEDRVVCFLVRCLATTLSVASLVAGWAFYASGVWRIG